MLPGVIATTSSDSLPLMDFGEALKALKDGRRVARTGWPEATWLVLVPGSNIVVDENRPLGRAAPHLVGGPVAYRPHIDKMREGEGMEPWIPTHGALLAEDWEVRFWG